MTIGNFCGAPFLALGDVIGRRGVNFAGNIIVIIAALLQGLAPNLATLMVGRFLLGFGSSMASAPQYVAEIAPLHLRGRLVGFFGTFFQFGSVIMIGAMTGFTKCELDPEHASLLSSPRLTFTPPPHPPGGARPGHIPRAIGLHALVKYAD